jgi:23S rRNA pseudouridine955/2504/2580 synthase
MQLSDQIQTSFYDITLADENQRIDNLLTKLLKGVPKNHIFRIIRSGEIRVNKKRVNNRYHVQLGDQIRIPPITISTSPVLAVKPNIPDQSFNVVYQDDYFLIIDKPSGVACHGGSGISFGVIEQLRQYYSNWPFLELAHRLDKDTSGLLILAKKRSGLVSIQELMKLNRVKKQYLALTKTAWLDKKRNIKAPLVKHVNIKGERHVTVDIENGKYAQTIFTLIKNFKDSALVMAELKTGRTHQIRVHLNHIDHPILGDQRYGDFALNKQLMQHGLKRMFLHAHILEFIHPITQQNLSLVSELPSELRKYLDCNPQF